VRYITRERIHVDRIATAWAIRRFVDREATFAFVPRTRDVSKASRQCAKSPGEPREESLGRDVPYDVRLPLFRRGRS
jgi:hypothetical protein